MAKWRCKVCGETSGSVPRINRHIAMAHHQDEQPICSSDGCLLPAECWSRNSKVGPGRKGRCRQHAWRYDICRWCGYPLDTGFGSGTPRCTCGSQGVLR